VVVHSSGWSKTPAASEDREFPQQTGASVSRSSISWSVVACRCLDGKAPACDWRNAGAGQRLGPRRRRGDSLAVLLRVYAKCLDRASRPPVSGWAGRSTAAGPPHGWPQTSGRIWGTRPQPAAQGCTQPHTRRTPRWPVFPGQRGVSRGVAGRGFELAKASLRPDWRVTARSSRTIRCPGWLFWTLSTDFQSHRPSHQPTHWRGSYYGASPGACPSDP
jgi:hypothetical protein